MPIQTETTPSWSIKADRMCVHCRSLPVTSENPENTHTLTTALNSIFKLNYLTAYNLLRKESLTEEMELLSLCGSCQKVLFDLEQLYENFLQLGQLDSYLCKQIRRVDEIMDSRLHEIIENSFMDNNTNDAVVKEEEENENNMSFDEDTGPNSPIQEQTQSPSSSTHANDNNNMMESKVKSKTLHQVFQPRIILTRLSKKLSQLPVVNSDKKDEDSDNALSEEEERKETRRVKSGRVSKSSKSRTNVKSKKKKSQKEKPLLTRERGKKKSGPTKGRPKDTPFYQNTRTCFYLHKRTRFPYPCWYCNKKDIQSPAECVEHTMTEHVPKLACPSSALICNRCAKISLSESNLRTHLIECEKIPVGVLLPKQYQCPHCSKSFGRKDILKMHLLIHEDETPYHCNVCDYKTKTPSTLRAHKMRKHKKSDTPEQNVQCDQCPSILKNEGMFKIHKYNMHTTEGSKRYKGYQKKALAKDKEKRAQRGPKSTICDDCNIDFLSRLALINHRRSAHKDTMSEYTCPICGKNFTTYRSYSTHTTIIHSNDRKFFCEICGKTFKQKYNLADHISHTHTEEGRLAYNRKMRESNQRRRLVAKQLANIECGESR